MGFKSECFEDNYSSIESSEFSEEQETSSFNQTLSMYGLDNLNETKDDKNDYKEKFLKSQADKFYKLQMRQMINYTSRKIIK